MSLPYTPAREYAAGIGDAVANRTINRKIVRPCHAYTQPVKLPRQDAQALDGQVAAWCKSNGFIVDGYTVTSGDDVEVEINLNVTGHIETEKWFDVAHRVATGNALMCPKVDATDDTVPALEFNALNHHLRQASILLSGRHLQHGDASQPTRPMEVYTNCSTSSFTFLSFYLLLNGSGVGRAYDDAMMVVDYSKLPIVVPVINQAHKDVLSGEIVCLDRRTAEHLYATRPHEIFEVPDSREGWAKALEKMEVMAFEGTHRDTVLILDFSNVRCKGSPIAGMQGRPASGPAPLMSAIKNIAQLRDAGMEPWRAAMFADHYAAECVLVGGARRAARMATKTWRDTNVLDFIKVKRGGFLWSSNNSVMVDADFWELVKAHRLGGVPVDEEQAKLQQHAVKVFDLIAECSYHDMTGEPGFINADKLTSNEDGLQDYTVDFAKSERYQLDPEALPLAAKLLEAFKGLRHKFITNPCGEITLAMIGGYCVIGDVVPFHAGLALNVKDYATEQDYLLALDADAEDAFRVTTRALIRTNLMNALYGAEVKRTNRIGVGMTGLHEYAWDRFQIGFRDMIAPDFNGLNAYFNGFDAGTSLHAKLAVTSKHTNARVRAAAFWLTLARFKRAVQDEARDYATELGVVVPHTNTTMKPAGTTSKLFGLTEGAHLPALREYLRWVQFRNDDPLVEEYRAKGYPVRKLQTYSGTTIVGFPTRPLICELGMGEQLVTAGEATPAEQYEYLRLLEQYWIAGVEEDGVTPMEERGNQVSYTLKMNFAKVSFEEYKTALTEHQSTVRCCSVMPQEDKSAYEYLPEQAVTKAEYELILNAIQRGTEPVQEDIGEEHVQCENGACPISFNQNEAAEA